MEFTNYCIEDIECKLYDLRNLAELHSRYFDSSKKYVEENSWVLVHEYERYGSLINAIIDTIDITQEMAKIIIENKN